MSDTETFWRERLERLARDEDTDTVDVRDDIARGRARLVRTRVAVAGAGVLAGAVVLGAGLALGAGGDAPRAGSLGPAGAGPPTAATYHEPETTVSSSPRVDRTPTPNPTSELDSREQRIRSVLEQSDASREAPFPAWRHRLFRLTQDVLDPSGTHLNYATESWQAGNDEVGVSLGIKMGWTNPGESGEGLVQVQISTEGGTDEDLCGLMAGFECPLTVQADGGTMRTGSSGSSFVVLYRRPDGERVVVLVDRLFGNNSRTPVRGLDVRRRDIYRYVQDDRLDLPQ